MARPSARPDHVRMESSSTGSPSSDWVVDCALNGFDGDKIGLSKGDAYGFGNSFLRKKMLEFLLK